MQKIQQQYVGQTSQSLKMRFSDTSPRLKITKAPSMNTSDLARVATTSTTLVSNHHKLSGPNKVILASKLNRSSKSWKTVDEHTQMCVPPRTELAWWWSQNLIQKVDSLNTGVCTLTMTHQMFDQSIMLNFKQHQYTFVPNKSIRNKWPLSPSDVIDCAPYEIKANRYSSRATTQYCKWHSQQEHN